MTYAILINNEWNADCGHAMISRLECAQRAAVRNERLQIRMIEHIVLVQPRPDHHIRRQVQREISFEFPQEVVLLQLLERFDNCVLLLKAEIFAFYVCAKSKKHGTGLAFAKKFVDFLQKTQTQL